MFTKLRIQIFQHLCGQFEKALQVLQVFLVLLFCCFVIVFWSQKQSQILDCFKDSEKSKIRSFGMVDPVSKIPAKNYSKKPNYLPIEGSTSSGLITISSSLKVRRIFRPFFRAGSSGIPIIKKQLRIGVSDGAKYSSSQRVIRRESKTDSYS